jgi:hypothetical protein
MVKVPRGHAAKAIQLFVTEINRLRVAAVGSNFHAAAAQSVSYDFDPPKVAALQVTAANATDLPTSLTLCNAIIHFYIQHFADTVAHKIADVTALPAEGAAVDLASAITAMTLVKATHATHIASTTVNYTADATNTLLTATPTDQTSLNTFANAAKTAINAHTAGALAGYGFQLDQP